MQSRRSASRKTVALAIGIAFASAIAALGVHANETLSDRSSVIAALAEDSLLLDAARIDAFIAVVGERGHILLSDDDGASWRQVKVPDRATLTTVYFADRQHGWAAGHDAIILRTTDGGESWDRVMYAPDEERPFLDIWFRDGQNGIAVGAYGLMMQTSDGGASWSDVVFTPQEPENDGDEENDDEYWDDDEGGADYHLNALIEDSDGTLYLAAEAGYVYRSDDNGESWVSLPSPYGGSFFAALAIGDNGLLVVGLRGHMFRTIDSGQSWQAIALPTEATLNSATQLSDGAIIVTGMDGTVLISTNDAVSFDLVRQRNRLGIAVALETQSGQVILIGDGGIKHLSHDALDES